MTCAKETVILPHADKKQIGKIFLCCSHLIESYSMAVGTLNILELFSKTAY